MLPAFLFFAAASLWAEDLGVDDAVKLALAHSYDLKGAALDSSSSSGKALAAWLKLVPSLQAYGSYTRLSDVKNDPITLPLPAALGGPQPIVLPSTGDNAFSFGAKLQYPIFAGFRIIEAAKLADSQTLGKKASEAIVKQAIEFEVRRAYWESYRAGINVGLLQQTVELYESQAKETSAQVAQGLQTNSDQLNADQKILAARMTLNDALSGKTQALIGLSTILGKDKEAQDLMADAMSENPGTYNPFALVSSPDPEAQSATQTGIPLDLAQASALALAHRADLKAADAAVAVATHAAAIARGGLYPTLSLNGDYTYADPNSRLFPPKDAFVGTWDLGLSLSYDIGGLPATIIQSDAAAKDLQRAIAARDKQKETAISDVRNCVLAVTRIRQDIALVSPGLSQAKENLRIVQEKFDHGLARQSEVLDAKLAYSRADLALENKQIDLVIALADLQRAVGGND